MRTGVILGAGGYVGQAFHLGALRALRGETGFDARRSDTMVGTSAGSLVAAGLAGGMSADDLAAELLGEELSPAGRALRARGSGPGAAADAWPAPPGRRRPLAPASLAAAARRPWGVRPAAVMSGLLPAGRMTTEPIARSVRGLHANGWPAGDLRICAVRARDARRVVFGTPFAPETDVGTAVAASCAIPAYFQPVIVDGAAYIDGGVHSPTNADVLLGEGFDLVLVLSPMSLSRTGRRPPLDLALRIAVRRYLALEVRKLRRTGTKVVVFQPGPEDLLAMGANPMRGSGVDEIVATVGRSVTRRLSVQPELGELLAGAAG